MPATTEGRDATAGDRGVAVRSKEELEEPMDTRPAPTTSPSGPVHLGRRFGITEVLTLIVAVALSGVGIAGFFATGFDDFAHHDTGEHLLGFELNPLHNIVHLVLGLIGLLAWTRLRSSIAYGALLAVGYGAAAVYGTFAIHEEWDVLSLNRPDNWLHIGLGIVGLVIVALGTWQLRHPNPSAYDDDDLVIDLTIEERLRDVMPESIHEPAATHRSTGLPPARRG